MKRRLRFFVCFALLLCCAPLHAQWSGSIDFAGGLGGMEGEGVDGGTIVDIDSIQGHVWEYRITPKSTDIDLDGDIHLENTLIDGDVQLKLTPGARLSTRHSLDHNSGATLECRGLLDQKLETDFESEDLKEFWVEEVRGNRRIFVLGASWKF